MAVPLSRKGGNKEEILIVSPNLYYCGNRIEVHRSGGRVGMGTVPGVQRAEFMPGLLRILLGLLLSLLLQLQLLLLLLTALILEDTREESKVTK